MIKTEFSFEGFNVVAYANSPGWYDTKNAVIKFVNEDGDRIYPHFTERKRDEIKELAMENLQNESGVEELRF